MLNNRSMSTVTGTSMRSSMASSITGTIFDGPPSIQFKMATKKLAKTYYPYIYVDKRRVSKAIVDAQCSLELSSDSLDEFVNVTSAISSFNFGIYGLQQALMRTISELSIIRDGILELSLSLKESERFNIRLFDQLSSLNTKIESKIESGKSSLAESKKCNKGDVKKINIYRVPRTLKEAMENVNVNSEISTLASAGISNILNEETSSEYNLAWIANMQRQIEQRHTEFSFLIIGLWSESVAEHERIKQSKQTTGCFGLGIANSISAPAYVNGFLPIKSGKSDEIPDIANAIFTRVNDLGVQIYEKLGKLAIAYEKSNREYNVLSTELAETKRQLIDALLVTHGAVQALIDLDEQNDALVGKLIKTRPLFSELHQALINGQLGVGEDGGKFKLLSEVLGPDGWQQLMDNLKTVKLPKNSNVSNRFNQDQLYFSKFPGPFALHKRITVSYNNRCRLRRNIY